MKQKREPIPKYSLLNPGSLVWTWYFKHGIHPLINYFVVVFTSCGEWLG